MWSLNVNGETLEQAVWLTERRWRANVKPARSEGGHLAATAVAALVQKVTLRTASIRRMPKSSSCMHTIQKTRPLRVFG